MKQTFLKSLVIAFTLVSALPALAAEEMTGQEFLEAAARGDNLKGVKVKPGEDISYCDLSNKDLSGIDASGTNMSHCNLSGAILSGARLVGTNLSYANLSGIRLN